MGDPRLTPEERYVLAVLVAEPALRIRLFGQQWAVVSAEARGRTYRVDSALVRRLQQWGLLTADAGGPELTDAGRAAVATTGR